MRTTESLLDNPRRTAAAFTELFVAAGVPSGVLNTVVAHRPTTQQALARVTGNYRRGNEKRDTRP
jgi:hypothetical protein